MRVLVGGITHESNTFSNMLTGERQFAGGVAEGEAIVQTYLGTKTSVGGFLQAAAELGIQPVFTLIAGAEPSGPVLRSTYEGFKARILDGVRRNQVDGIYLALHGAMVVTEIGDGEGDLLKAVREIVGPDLPIAVSLDLHALLTDDMLNNASVIVFYKTYPHVDMAERAVDATRLLARTIQGEIRPVYGHRRLRLLPPVTRMRTAIEPMVSVGRRMVELEQTGEALTASFNHTFPYSDFPYVGSGSLVYTDSEPARAQSLADELADYVWQRRELLWHEPTPIPEAVDRALRHPGAPVVISDGADNPGGGSASDSVEILRELLRRKVSPAAVGTIWDPGAVELLWNAGVGSEIELRIGGKVDRFHGDPIDVRGTVERLHDGSFTHKGPMSRGSAGNLGRTAVLRVDGVRVVLNSQRVQNYDPEIFRCVGIEPTDQKIVVVKSVVHFRAAYEPLASLVVEADGPGLTSLDHRLFPFRNVPRPIFGLDRF
ncbi:MAG TPA: M81 family metallopeptidase [Chloroflexota bacterium]|nr:M81 family metallopeptidase [Chloroflexota bacterium]